MERSAEWFMATTGVVMGLSHLLHPRAWAETFAAMHRLGRPGAFLNGGLSLFPGAAFVAVHPVWSGPAVLLTLFGCALVVKGSVYLLAPDLALASMGRAAAGNGRGFRIAGALLLLLSGAVGGALYLGRS
ncbi:MAG: hypothetical protein ACRDD1_02800 [Planctomycetia bacterium]